MKFCPNSLSICENAVPRYYPMTGSAKTKENKGGGSSAPKDGKKKGGHDEDRTDPWWTNGLILAMAFWTFAIIFCKTVVEYQ